MSECFSDDQQIKFFFYPTVSSVTGMKKILILQIQTTGMEFKVPVEAVVFMLF
jgi:hypothetical protein